MDWNEPVPIKLGDQASVWTKATLFFGHYDARIYTTQTAYLEVGAGSWQFARRIVSMEGFAGCMGRVGRQCEIAESWVLHGGDHRNDLPVNIGFSQIPLYQMLIGAGGQSGVVEAPPISIGDNVVLSWGATVLGGVKVGSGAVVGAGAVVVKDVEPFSVVGGVPAKELKRRFPAGRQELIEAARWWDFAPDYMAGNLERIQVLAEETGPHRYRQTRPRLTVRLTNSIEILGFVDGDEEKPLNEAPEKVRNYAAQAAGVGPYHWLADCWS